MNDFAKQTLIFHCEQLVKVRNDLVTSIVGMRAVIAKDNERIEKISADIASLEDAIRKLDAV